MRKRSEPRRLKGKLSISKPHSGENEYVEIIVMDESSGCVVLELQTSISDFASAMFGLFQVDCDCQWFDAPLGKKCENKTEVVTYKTKGVTSEKEMEREVEKAIEKLEIDGWIGSVRDALNHHNWISTDNGKRSVRVNFHRFV